MSKSHIYRAQELCINQTNAEQFKWKRVLGHRFEGIRFRRKVVIGNYIIDMADNIICRKTLIMMRIRHAIFQERGLVVIRFWNNDLETIRNHVLMRAALTPPLPRAGEGDLSSSD